MGILQTLTTFGMVLAGLGVVVAILPTEPRLPDEFINSIATVITYIQPWGYLINFSVLLNIAIFVAGFEIIAFTIRVAIWVFDEVYNRA